MKTTYTVSRNNFGGDEKAVESSVSAGRVMPWSSSTEKPRVFESKNAALEWIAWRALYTEKSYAFTKEDASSWYINEHFTPENDEAIVGYRVKCPSGYLMFDGSNNRYTTTTNKPDSSAYKFVSQELAQSRLFDYAHKYNAGFTNSFSVEPVVEKPAAKKVVIGYQAKYENLGKTAYATDEYRSWHWSYETNHKPFKFKTHAAAKAWIDRNCKIWNSKREYWKVVRVVKKAKSQ